MNKKEKVMIIGSGPIIIGQAAEFDYAGTQACKSLREEGVTTVLVNSNPATIMTDKTTADIVYIEPLTPEMLEKIIAKERPTGLLPTLGGQTGLNLAMELADAGVLDRYQVDLLGTSVDTIRKAEDRSLFHDLLVDIGEPVPQSQTVSNLADAKSFASMNGFPLVIRPAYTLGGTGGGIAYDEQELEIIVSSGLAASPITQVLVERSLLGWKEIEYEVMRDSADTCITICNMENLDPMGVHTGDSIVVAPSQTLTDKEYQMLRSAAIKIIRALKIEGGCNVQFALPPCEDIAASFSQSSNNPSSDNSYYVIEVNPRVSRSSALASKATGYPIARVAAKIAIGRKLSEIPNAVTKKTTAAFEPALDYCVVKIPRWPFDKFASGDRRLGTQMKATGEVMAIDRSFEAALQKAVRSLEVGGKSLLWEDPSWKGSRSKEKVRQFLYPPSDLRIWALAAALRRGIPIDDVARSTGVDPWFLKAIQNVIRMEHQLLSDDLSPSLLRSAKRLGFSDEQISVLADRLPSQVREMRLNWGISPVYKMVDTCAAEFEAVTPYFYSTYEEENEAQPLSGSKALVLGSGPIRIGQGIEFDYCSVHGSLSLHSAGYKSIMLNSNPETVSTDFDVSSRLYFEPLDEESVLDIIDNEGLNAKTGATPSLVQYGGQTAINLSQFLGRSELPVLGSSAEVIDRASDRHKFEEFLLEQGIPQPPGGAVTTIEAALDVAERIGFPLLVRPSYVLGGRAMEIVQSHNELIRYLNNGSDIGQGHPILIDTYLEGQEVEVDAICDGKGVLIPAIMEHVERAGVHSGDSMAVCPPMSLSQEESETIIDYTTRIGMALGVRGLMNIQYVIMRGKSSADQSRVYVIEVNPRASRTIPFISKITGIPMIQIATEVMIGRSIKKQGYAYGLAEAPSMIGVKAPVFSMAKLAGVDTYLGPEMKSTGEVMGVDLTLDAAIAKALIAANLVLPPNGSILITVADKDKQKVIPLVKSLFELEYVIYATEGTGTMIKSMGYPVKIISKHFEKSHPNAIDIIMDGTVNAVLNTTSPSGLVVRDGVEIRRAAAEQRIPCYTSIDTARVAIQSLARPIKEYSVRPIFTSL